MFSVLAPAATVVPATPEILRQHTASCIQGRWNSWVGGHVLPQILLVQETKPSSSLCSTLHTFGPSASTCIVMAWCEKLKLDNASTILLSSY